MAKIVEKRQKIAEKRQKIAEKVAKIAEKWQKSPKSVIKTSTPGRPACLENKLVKPKTGEASFYYFFCTKV
jgi:hypothetical protein